MPGFLDFMPFIGNAIGEGINALNVFGTNKANMQMNRENIAFQQAENDIARQREDNAVQRRAADLTAAGLSKTLAAGSAASANAMVAPQNKFEKQAFKLQNAEIGTSIMDNYVKKKQLSNESIRLDIERDDLKRKMSETESNIALNTITGQRVGLPPWYNAVYDALGYDKAKELANKYGDVLVGIGNWIYNQMFGDGNPPENTSEPLNKHDSVNSSPRVSQADGEWSPTDSGSFKQNVYDHSDYGSGGYDFQFLDGKYGTNFSQLLNSTKYFSRDGVSGYMRLNDDGQSVLRDQLDKLGIYGDDATDVMKAINSILDRSNKKSPGINKSNYRIFQ